ncbi:MAG: hypothetical protein L6R38_001701 [Xanthoria sp. 2 TBL-2021]|nr:MAG: hypothetical protein L6R38_001701 [Xanthoria sp. 2 TBL-2021]
MAQKSYRKSQLIAFDNVAAGHEGVLSDPSGAVVIKPCSQAEVDFYHSITGGVHSRFATFIPTFMGTLELNSESDPAAAVARTAIMNPTEAGQSITGSPHTIPNAPVVEKAWAPSNGGKIKTDLAIVLENIAAPFQKPNILDVKLGARLWDDNAPPAKRTKLDKVAEETTSKSLGLRIAGMRTWQGAAASAGSNGISKDGYRLYDKHYGRTLTTKTIRQGFEDYFLLERGGVIAKKSPLRVVVKRFLEDLMELKSALENEESRMYSASLLFVYEGNRDALVNALAREREEPVNGINGDEVSEEEDDEQQVPAVQGLKLIDFAHAEWTPGQGPDENLLQGLRYTIEVLEGLLEA